LLNLATNADEDAAGEHTTAKLGSPLVIDGCPANLSSRHFTKIEITAVRVSKSSLNAARKVVGHTQTSNCVFVVTEDVTFPVGQLVQTVLRRVDQPPLVNN